MNSCVCLVSSASGWWCRLDLRAYRVGLLVHANSMDRSSRHQRLHLGRWYRRSDPATYLVVFVQSSLQLGYLVFSRLYLHQFVYNEKYGLQCVLVIPLTSSCHSMSTPESELCHTGQQGYSCFVASHPPPSDLFYFLEPDYSVRCARSFCFVFGRRSLMSGWHLYTVCYSEQQHHPASGSPTQSA